ncbi:MAG: hypothetical protein M1818_002702 [Claussenomyces sp. TS43310]|nr:MAG: hypothetical protein M1818_002702 [Claussenomyces sp. TS43310]
MVNFTITFLICIGQTVLIVIGLKYIAAALPVLIVVVILLQKFYLKTSRQLRLLDIEAKSPLVSHLLDAVTGLLTIRAFGWKSASKAKNTAVLERSQRPYYLLFCVQIWLSLVLDLMVAVLAVILVAVAVTTRSSSSGLIPLALLNIVSFSFSLKNLVFNWTSLELSMGAIARVQDFSTQTESESRPGETYVPPEDWPQKGCLEFKKVTAFYNSPTNPVLKDISFSISGGQKLGICGRSGSGKSSLISCLLRTLDVADGSIILDGIDLSTVPRQEVRSRLNTLPQESIFLPGSLRYNIDPSRCVSDEKIMALLESLQLWDAIKGKGGLDAVLDDDLLSHGQRQMVCLARSMLAEGKVFILDEATSSIDTKTNALLQRIINTHFAQHTIIAIAHRLDMLLDFDLVAVLDQGAIVELDHPRTLLAREGSAFERLWGDLHRGGG